MYNQSIERVNLINVKVGYETISTFRNDLDSQYQIQSIFINNGMYKSASRKLYQINFHLTSSHNIAISDINGYADTACTII